MILQGGATGIFEKCQQEVSMKDKHYMPTAVLIYLHYLVHGVALIILSQCAVYLREQMNTDYAGIMFVISGLGIGKVITQYMGGILSDRIGRKPVMYLCVLCYIMFFLGILWAPNIYVGFACYFLCGVGNTCLDSGGSNTLMEIMDSMVGTASILTKLFIVVGQFILPVILGVIAAKEMYYGLPFMACAGICILIGIGMIKAPFVSTGTQRGTSRESSKKVKYPLGPEGIGLILIGYTSTATFHTFTSWGTIYARDVAGLSEVAAQTVMSFYSVGAFLSILAMAFLVKKTIKPVRILFVYPVLAALMLAILFLFPSEITCRVMGFLIGCFAGGGVFQLSVAVSVEFFPEVKGAVTGMIYTASGVALFADPVLTGWLSEINMRYVLLYDIGAAVVGVLLAIMVNRRYDKRFGDKR